MTTKIVVDAHAGWDVEVLVETLDNDGGVTENRVEVVPKNTIKEFYIHSHMSLGRIKELKP